MLEAINKWLALFGVLAAIFYGVLRLAYVQFYLHLGVRPEEVGIGRAEIISQSIIGPLLLATIPAIIALLISLVGALREKRKDPFIVALRQSWVRILAPVLIVFLLFLGLILVSIYSTASHLRNLLVDQGEAITGGYTNLRVVHIPVLDIRALPAQITWKDATNRAAPFSGSSTPCLMYLGEANSMAVAYDVKNARTLRFPSNDVVISLDTESLRLSPNCKPFWAT